MELELRSYNNYRTAGVVNSLSKKVLAEPSLLSLEHVGKGFGWSVAGSLGHLLFL